MPLYTFHTTTLNKHFLTRTWDPRKRQAEFAEKIQDLHAKTFGTDAALVRVEFVFEVEGRFGGPGSSARSSWNIPKPSDHLVATIAFDGSADEWKAYCKEIANLWEGGQLRSIYLVKLDMEIANFGDGNDTMELVDRKEMVADEKGSVVVAEGSNSGDKELPPYER